MRKDGTYDIDYDDGDKEKSVEYSLIKKEEAGEEEEEAEVGVGCIMNNSFQQHQHQR